jgi:hypothetical protein
MKVYVRAVTMVIPADTLHESVCEDIDNGYTSRDSV